MAAKSFRARQLFQWIYKRAETDFAAMTDLAKDFRAQLEQVAEIRLPEIITRQDSTDGTVKWMLKAGTGEAANQGIEMVYIPEEGRSTLCISSQVGCAMDCSFCATAQQGFNSNLSTAEIVGQVLLAQRELGFKAGDDRIISNVVLMGMGEPLANFRNVVPATRILLDELGLDFSRRRLTLSTSGLVPQIYKLAEESNVALAVVAACAGRRAAQPARAHQPPAQHRRAAGGPAGLHRRGQWPQHHLRYVMLDGVNDSPAQARALARLPEGHPAKVNLIPFNPFPARRTSVPARPRSRPFWTRCSREE